MPVRWIRFQGKMDDEAERGRVRKTELYRMGDTILVWVNEGDICLEVNMDPTHLDINDENERLKAGIAELRTHNGYEAAAHGRRYARDAGRRSSALRLHGADLARRG
jgi:hypothetical protein